MIGCLLAWKFNCIKPFFLQSGKVASFPGLPTVQFLIACTHMMHCKKVWVTLTIFWSPQFQLILLCA